VSKQWQYLTVEVKPSLMGALKADAVQSVLEKQGRLGWELVNVIVPAPAYPALLIFKKES
jgi:hypothetical protein